jgi:hypothetical protein
MLIIDFYGFSFGRFSVTAWLNMDERTCKEEEEAKTNNGELYPSVAHKRGKKFFAFLWPTRRERFFIPRKKLHRPWLGHFGMLIESQASTPLNYSRKKMFYNLHLVKVK